MGRSIEDLRAEGEKTIEGIIDYLNTYCKDYTKDSKNSLIESILAEPKSISDILQSTSLGFIELDEENSIPVINEEKLQRRAKGKNFEVLRDMLLNQNMNFVVLDKILELNGYISAIYDDYDIENILEIKDDLYVIYTVKNSTEAQVKISFEITRDCSQFICEENFYLKVTDIQKY